MEAGQLGYAAGCGPRNPNSPLGMQWGGMREPSPALGCTLRAPPGVMGKLHGFQDPPAFSPEP
eukprot:12921581-Prorocentrum_lima.AAC.1